MKLFIYICKKYKYIIIMENVILLSENGINDFLDFLDYGSNLVRFDSLDSEAKFNRYISVINELVGKDSIRIVMDEETEEGTVYSVIWSDKDSSPPSITEEEVELLEVAKRAYNQKTIIQININPKLKMYAKKIAENNGVRLTSSGGVFFFNGANKKPSVFPLIQQAYNEGKKFIEFDSKDVQAQTVRIYASQFNTFMGKKFSVSANKDKVRIQFEPFTPQEQAVESFKKIVNDLVLLGVLNEERGKFVVNYVNRKNFETAEVEEKIQPLLLKEDGQFKIPETEEEEAFAGNSSFDYDQAGNKFATDDEDDF